MSIKTWKKIISISVLAIIVSLTVAVVILGNGDSNKTKLVEEQRETISELEEKINFLTASENVINLEDILMTEDIDVDKIKNIIAYFGQGDSGLNPDYISKYKNLYVDNDFIYEPTNGKKICYLTFDDGPSLSLTGKILDVLKQYNAKATFFVVYNDSKEAKELYKRMIDEGHTIGVHTASHNYTKIYSSVNDYLADFNKVAKLVEEVTGVKPEIFRFPGGSINSYNIGTYQAIIAEMLRRGYTYYDWSISSGDAAASYVKAEDIAKNVLKHKDRYDNPVILMHDGNGHANTLKALPTIIEGMKNSGFSFEALTKDVEPCWFSY